jgi:hypothetical protein
MPHVQTSRRGGLGKPFLDQTPSPSPKIREIYYNGSDLGEAGGRPRFADRPPIIAKKLCTSVVVAAVCSRRRSSYVWAET